MKRSILGGLAVVLMIGVTACGGADKGDAKVEPGGVNTTGARVIQMPDGFRNAAAKCDGPNMVYSASRGDNTDTSVAGSIAVVPNDPRCK